jgi:hypothetical protein
MHAQYGKSGIWFKKQVMGLNKITSIMPIMIKAIKKNDQH